MTKTPQVLLGLAHDRDGGGKDDLRCVTYSRLPGTRTQEMNGIELRGDLGEVSSPDRCGSSLCRKGEGYFFRKWEGALPKASRKARAKAEVLE